MGLWLQVNTTDGDIYSRLSTPADASRLPTLPGGSWIEVQEAEYEIAVNGERTSWNNAAALGSRVEENPYPRLRFTGGNVTGKPYEFAVEVGESTPPTVTLTVVTRDGVVVPTNATRRIFIVGTVQKYKTITMSAGSATFSIPVGAPRIIRINDQKKVLNNSGDEVDGFLVEDPLLVVVAESVSNTEL